MRIGTVGLLDLLRKRDGLFASRPAIYIGIVLVAVITAYPYRLLTEGIFSCQADGYSSDRYLAYCNGGAYGDYEHGALWFDLEPSAKEFASDADAIFLGDSFSQFGFSTDVTSQWFSAASSRYYLLGFLYGENVVFEEEILRKLKPAAKLYVIPVRFFERVETLPAKEVMHDPASGDRYKSKYYWQLVHKAICERLAIICGHRFAVFRSRETGAYQKSGRLADPRANSPAYSENGVDQEKVKSYSVSGRSFISRLPVRRDCIILTTLPADRVSSPSIETAEAIAKDLGVNFVPGARDDLRTFDGLHLDKTSAERWSNAFFQVAGPQILQCIKDDPKKHT